jgi:hypothetical protein
MYVAGKTALILPQLGGLMPHRPATLSSTRVVSVRKELGGNVNNPRADSIFYLCRLPKFTV